MLDHDKDTIYIYIDLQAILQLHRLESTLSAQLHAKHPAVTGNDATPNQHQVPQPLNLPSSLSDSRSLMTKEMVRDGDVILTPMTTMRAMRKMLTMLMLLMMRTMTTPMA